MVDTKVNSSFHLGHRVIESLRKHSNLLFQIDGATGEQETCGSVVTRAIKLAKSLRKLGMKPGDVLAFSGHNHLDLHIPLLSALFNGMPSVAVDPYFKYVEIKRVFEIASPKVAFCDESTYQTYCDVSKDLNLSTKIIKFGDGKDSLAEFIEQSDDNHDFTVAEFDTDKIYAFLILTSGTIGGVKLAAVTHQTTVDVIIKPGHMKPENTGTPLLLLSPANWLTSYHITIIAALAGQCRLLNSTPNNWDVVIDMINKYKRNANWVMVNYDEACEHHCQEVTHTLTILATEPRFGLFSPSTLVDILKRKKDADLTCLKFVVVTGSKVKHELLEEFQACMRPGALLMESYGQTEAFGSIMMTIPGTPPGSNGKPVISVKLIDIETGKEITRPNQPGELCIKGSIFTEYYNSPEETASSFTDDGYFKTGDIFYKDEQDYFYLVDRLKALIKYKNFQVPPMEIEETILNHEGVSAVCVVGVDDPEDVQRPAACVVRKIGSSVTAQEIKELVANNLSEYKRLTGGVVFLKELPLTSTGKIARGKLRDLIQNIARE